MSLTTEQLQTIVSNTKNETHEHNSHQKYKKDDKSYIQIFSDRKDEFLAKAGVKNPSWNELYQVESAIINKEIKDILQNTPELSKLNKLVDVGAVSLMTDQKDYPSLEFYHENLKNGMYTLMSVEPCRSGDELSKGVKVYSWGDDELFPAKDLKSGLLDAQKIAHSVVAELKEKEDLKDESKSVHRTKLKM